MVFLDLLVEAVVAVVFFHLIKDLYSNYKKIYAAEPDAPR